MSTHQSNIISRFYLPFPPSVNGAYKNVGNMRAKSRKVLDWEKDASRMYDAQNIMSIRERVIIVFSLTAPDRRTRDEQNYAKVTTDFLVRKGMLAGDDARYIQSTVTMWMEGENPGVEVYVLKSDENLLEKILR